MKTRILFAGIATCLLTFGSVSTYAATQGTLGGNSTGSIDITASKGEQAQITELNDIALGNWKTGDPDLIGNDDICVYSSTGAYSVTVTSTNGDSVNKFVLKDGVSEINYNVSWDTDTQGVVGLTEGTVRTGRNGDATSVTCANALNGSTNATLAISIPAATMAAATVGSYSDTLTILINPE